MTRPWIVRLLIAVAVLTAAVPAVAAPGGATCPLLRDDEGDVQKLPGTDSVPDDRDAQLDILSADVAVDSKQVTVVLRLRDLAAPDPTDPNGLSYEFDFTAKEQTFFVVAVLLTGGTDFRVYAQDRDVEQSGSSARSGTSVGAATGTLDLRRHEIRMTAPLTVFASKAQLTSGTALYDLAAWTWRANGVYVTPAEQFAAVAENADDAIDKRVSYRVGQPSCFR